RAVAGLAQILTLGARFEDARALAEEALILARAVGARDIEGHAQDTLGLDRAAAGEIEPALDDIRAALAIAREAGNLDDMGRADDAAAIATAALRQIDFTPEVKIGELHAIGVRAYADVSELARARRSSDQLRAAIIAGEGVLDAIRRRHADVVATRPALSELS